MNPPKPRKRIVPQLLSSPTGTSKHKIDALSGPLQVDNLKEQYTQAKELLGPGRKIYVNLAPYQTEHKQVSWKRVGCCGVAHTWFFVIHNGSTDSCSCFGRKDVLILLGRRRKGL